MLSVLTGKPIDFLLIFKSNMDIGVLEYERYNCYFFLCACSTTGY